MPLSQLHWPANNSTLIEDNAIGLGQFLPVSRMAMGRSPQGSVWVSTRTTGTQVITKFKKEQLWKIWIFNAGNGKEGGNLKLCLSIPFTDAAWPTELAVPWMHQLELPGIQSYSYFLSTILRRLHKSYFQREMVELLYVDNSESLIYKEVKC